MEADYWLKQGNALFAEHQYAAAAQAYERGLALFPQSAELYSNLANTLLLLRDHRGAIRAFDKAIKLNPNMTASRWSRALTLLSLGNYEQGWAEYEWRWADGLKLFKAFKEPIWGGEDISGKSILLVTEQGYGDNIQMIRYAEATRKKGAQVFVVCKEPVKRLFEAARGVDHVFLYEDELPSFDFICPMMSLPRAHRTTLDTVPSGIPYFDIKTSPDELYKKSGLLNVGLLWHVQTADLERSCPLDYIIQSLSDISCQLYSFQVDPESIAIAKSSRAKIWDVGSRCPDFLALAEHLKAMDWIISVDSSIAHLSGALGLPVILLLPYDSNWRWMIDCDESPWYPTMRLLRQKRPGDWTSLQPALSAIARSFNLNEVKKIAPNAHMQNKTPSS